MKMPRVAAHWEHFAHAADVGIRGFGNSVAQAFEQAALAMGAVVCDLDTVQARERLVLNCEAAVGKREDYFRANAACLDPRGYSAR
jgi:SHS2 domain-containing protein